MVPVSPPAGNYEAEHRRLLNDLADLVAIGELTVEDFAVVDARYQRLRAMGAPFAVEFRLIMSLLEKQARHTDDDPDSDLCVDDGQEADDPNEDYESGDGEDADWLVNITDEMAVLP